MTKFNLMMKNIIKRNLKHHKMMHKLKVKTINFKIIIIILKK